MKFKIACSAALALLALSAPSYGAGVCSTGQYNSCVTCCQLNPTITNRSLCKSQCEGYKRGGSIRGGVLKREPGKGKIATGARVLVDDGTCPKGQIKEVTGGSGDAGRTRRCIAR
jgi:hypothetical protein